MIEGAVAGRPTVAYSYAYVMIDHGNHRLRWRVSPGGRLWPSSHALLPSRYGINGSTLSGFGAEPVKRRHSSRPQRGPSADDMRRSFASGSAIPAPDPSRSVEIRIVRSVGEG